MLKCWFCGGDMIWGSDFTFEDWGLEGEGIVASFSCNNPDCGSTAEFYKKEEEEKCREA